MSKIEFIEECKNLYAVIDGTKRFVYHHHNIFENFFYYDGKEYKNINAMFDAMKDNIINHNGKYFSRNCAFGFDNPFEFINWLKENGAEETLDCGFEKSDDGNYTLFYGGYVGDFENEEMVFDDFDYLIYDEKMLNELQRIIDIMFDFEICE